MIGSIAVLAFVTFERGAELVWAQRNTRRLLARGAQEEGAAHYPLIVALHAAWLAGLWLLARGAREASPGHYPLIVGLHAAWLVGLWALAWDRPVSIPWLALFALLQAGRLWVLATLGQRWTTRIIVLPGEALVRRGPYRLIPHPNYAVVAGEILVLPLAFGLVPYGLIFSVLNAVVLWVRIRAEETALTQALP